MKIANEDWKKTVSRCSHEITGPVIFDFVRWVLDEAVRKNIKTLYFFARDGYIPFQISKMFAEYLELPISCKYLYCSRRALRIPTYHFIGEEAYKMLSLGGYYVTVDSLLNRGAIAEEYKEKILQELEVDDTERTKPLLKRELTECTQRLCENPTYRAAIAEVSKSAYPATIGYLRQEGLFEQDVVAVVDSGWTGSMQRSLRQLLESDGFTGKMVGFYFGLYRTPRDARDGEYFTYYFNETGATKDKVLFCNNLFECLLSAPHGMTMRYVEKNGRFEAALGKEPTAATADLVSAQIEGILDYAQTQLPALEKPFNKDSALETARKNLHRLMSKPTQKESEAYGSFLFDDDVADDNKRSLAGESQIASLHGYSIPARIVRKLRKTGGNMTELFWPYGTIAFLPPWKRWWYWWNVTVWEWLKYHWITLKCIFGK